MCTNIGLTGSKYPFAKVLIGGVSDDPYDIRTRVVVERSVHGYAFIGTELKALSEEVSMPGYNASVGGWPTRAQRKGPRLHLDLRPRKAGECCAR